MEEECKCDMRFADDYDLDDLFNLICSVNNFEASSNNPDRYRTESSTAISKQNLEIELKNSTHCRWLVLDTVKDESLVGALKLTFMTSEDGSKSALATMVYIAKNVPFDAVFAQLLFNLERIVYSHGYVNVIIEIPAPCMDLIDFVSNRGYDDRGGYLVSDSALYLFPVMMLKFSKVLSANNKLKENAQSNISEDLSIGLDAFEIIDSDITEMGDGVDSQMKSIFTDLFSALNKEYPEHVTK